MVVRKSNKSDAGGITIQERDPQCLSASLSCGKLKVILATLCIGGVATKFMIEASLFSINGEKAKLEINYQ